MRKPRASKAATATPAPAAPEQVWLRCEDLGETKPFTPTHAARILVLQDRMKVSGPGTWQPAAAPDTSESA